MENEEMIGGDDEGEKRETEKMEKFFSIIRDFKNARDRRLKELMKEDAAASKKIKLSPCSSSLSPPPPRRAGDRKIAGSNWVPTFEWEDFRREKKKRKVEEDDDGLKLKLSLS
ncbi:uncharacterized protein LOC124911125 [Impatiens glandulifera]|uniref:uncharacterized protein LOC124911125 n=1 Tax=Impatiens glandulifera TaxID=253017 RepID=UPI001FB0DC2B|nr:uncharacterized protein LOC124911125 [Impatiens glandulifera]